ncbi:hypothetical protein M0802_003328 [Mischocyttarus mexicanus]|nr:hypothetical protein M0802_003328 [Mischocyttarus mexicanus]
MVSTGSSDKDNLYYGLCGRRGDGSGGGGGGGGSGGGSGGGTGIEWGWKWGGLRSLEAAGLELCGGGGSVPQGQPSSAGSVGSAPSPASPRPTPQPRPPLATTTSQPSRTLDDDRSTDVGAATAAEDSDDGESRAQYVSANCVIFNNYRGDAASEVEEHFQRALAHDKPKENISPMSMRNFPPSFWNSQHPGDVYEYPADPWHAHYGPYQHRAVHEYHQHNMAAAASYSGLLLGSARGHHTSHHAAHHAAHHVHAAASYKDWTSATPSQSLVDVSSAPPYPHGPYASLSGEYYQPPMPF